MSYCISEDMQLEDFDTVIEVIDYFIIKMESATGKYSFVDKKDYKEYTTEEYKTALKTFCSETKERISQLENLIQAI